jgi:hypothetical protein
MSKIALKALEEILEMVGESEVRKLKSLKERKQPKPEVKPEEPKTTES